MYIYIYICTHTHIYLYICGYYVDVSIHICIYIYIYICTHTCICMCMCRRLVRSTERKFLLHDTADVKRFVLFIVSSRPWGLWILACICFLRQLMDYYGLAHGSMYLDMGFGTLDLKCCELKVWGLPVRNRFHASINQRTHRSIH